MMAAIIVGIAMISYVPVTLAFGAMLLERIVGWVERLGWWSQPADAPSDERIMGAWLVLWPQPFIAAAIALFLQITWLRDLIPVPRSSAADSLLILGTPLPALGFTLAYVLGISPGRGLLIAVIYVAIATFPAVLLIGGVLSAR